MRPGGREPYYRADLARIHHQGFGFHADAVAPGILKLLEPVLERQGLVVEIGCGSGLLTKYLVDGGHRVLATDASEAMLNLARGYAPGAAGFAELRLPGDAIPAADAIVSVGHPVNYLDDEDQLFRAFDAMAAALRLSGLIAFDVCDLRWGEARHDQAPLVWDGDGWLLVTRTSQPGPAIYRRDMTMFTHDGDDLWRRDREVHDNVLMDTRRIPEAFARHGVDVEVRDAFGAEKLPEGLVAVVGSKG